MGELTVLPCFPLCFILMKFGIIKFGIAFSYPKGDDSVREFSGEFWAENINLGSVVCGW